MSDPGYGRVLRDLARVLTFRISGEEIAAFGLRHAVVGVLATWLVGIGRYWDAPRAEVWQVYGLGSVIYLFALATFIWLIVLPLWPRRWQWSRIFIYLSLTAPPALLYAIPVERFWSMRTAADINVWFLAVVALWRVGLLAHLLRCYPRFRPVVVTLLLLLPLALIVFSLAMLNLEHAAFQIMGGIRDRTANDAAYFVVLVLAFFAFFAAAPLTIMWMVCLWIAGRERANGRNNPLLDEGLADLSTADEAFAAAQERQDTEVPR